MSDLVAIHAVHLNKLRYAIQSGLFVAPSIAITKPEYLTDRFGPCIFVCPRELVNPERGVPVFDADSYSSRYPRVYNKPNHKVLDALTDRIKQVADEAGVYIGDADSVLESDGEEELVRKLRPAMALQYLQETGRTYEVIKREPKLRYPWARQPVFLDFVKQNEEALHFNQPLEERKALVPAALEAARKAASEWLDSVGLDGDPELVEAYADDASYLSGLDRIVSELKKNNAPVVDKRAMSDFALSAVEGDAAFEDWVTEAITGVTHSQYVQSAGGRKYAYTPENVLRVMKQRGEQGGEGFNYGPASIRAHGLKRFRTWDDIEAHADNLVDEETFTEYKDQNLAQWGELTRIIEPYSDDKHVTRALTDALQDAYKRGRRLSTELKRNGIDVPPDILKEIAQFSADLQAAPTNYFEAKPMEIVRFNEFLGLVVPAEHFEEIKEAMKPYALPVQGYESDTERNEIVARMSAHDRKAQVNQHPPHRESVDHAPVALDDDWRETQLYTDPNVHEDNVRMGEYEWTPCRLTSKRDPNDDASTHDTDRQRLDRRSGAAGPHPRGHGPDGSGGALRSGCGIGGRRRGTSAGVWRPVVAGSADRLKCKRSELERAFRLLGGEEVAKAKHTQWRLPGATKQLGLSHGTSKIEGQHLSGWLRSSGIPALLVLWALHGDRLSKKERSQLADTEWPDYGLSFDEEGNKK